MSNSTTGNYAVRSRLNERDPPTGVPMIQRLRAVAASLHGQPRVRYLVLLALMYASFAVRRYGLRAGEVALIATMAMYFAGSSGVRIDELGWFVGGTHRIRRATSDA